MMLEVGYWMLDVGHCEDEGRSRILDVGHCEDEGRSRMLDVGHCEDEGRSRMLDAKYGIIKLYKTL